MPISGLSSPTNSKYECKHECKYTPSKTTYLHWIERLLWFILLLLASSDSLHAQINSFGNAVAIRGRLVCGTIPANADVLTWNAASSCWEPQVSAGGGGAHDHTSAVGDGGVLTNDEHDGYSEYTAIAVPASPAINKARLHAIENNGHTRLQYLDDDGIPFVVSRDNSFIGKNITGVAIAKGSAVYITGSSGNVPTIDLAKADSLTTLPAVGITMAAINNNAFGQVLILGVLDAVNTSAFSTGDRLFVSTTVAGALTSTRPVSPLFVQRIGSVMVSGIGNGSIYTTTALFVGGEESGTSVTPWKAAGVINAVTGYQVNGAASSGKYLKGNGTNFIESTGSAAGTGSCTNQFVRAENADAAPTCATVGAADLATNQNISTIGITIDGGGSVITTGVHGFIPVEFACTINQWTLLSTDASATVGSIVIDVWKDTYANYPPTVLDTIAGSELPTLSSVNKNQDTSLSTWTTSVTAGDIIGWNVNSATTVTRVTLTLKCART